MVWIWIAVVVWVLIGAAIAVFQRRRGHNFGAWLALGVVLGPLLIVPVIDAARRSTVPITRVLHRGTPVTGGVDIVVGIDGSKSSAAVLASVLATFEDSIGRLALATVLDYDVAGAPARWHEDEDATAHLAQLASTVPGRDPTTVLLTGRAAHALVKFARLEGYDLIAIGPRAHSASTTAFGSVAHELAREHEVPLLITGTRRLDEDPSHRSASDGQSDR